MNVKLETFETAILKLLQEKVNEDNKKASESINMLQSYASLLSKKYELSTDGAYSLSSDFSIIIEAPKPTSVRSEATVREGESDVTSEVQPKRRKKKQSEPEVAAV
jgi:hypothetical protein